MCTGGGGTTLLVVEVEVVMVELMVVMMVVVVVVEMVVMAALGRLVASCSGTPPHLARRRRSPGIEPADFLLPDDRSYTF